LVSTNINAILGLEKGQPDIVVWEGDPLEFGASVVVAVEGEDGAVSSCWPFSE
jgi:hypothetical protein